MDKASQELFNKLTRMQPHEWSPTDIEFMKARQSYLSEAQRSLFAEVLGASKESAGEQNEEEAAPAKAGRRK